MFLENKKREGIKCANEEPESVFLNARSQNAWQNAKCARSTFMKELVLNPPKFIYILLYIL
jgi:hypothetical protein